jgi:RNA polymerase-binding transcription factor DksA
MNSELPLQEHVRREVERRHRALLARQAHHLPRDLLPESPDYVAALSAAEQRELDSIHRALERLARGRIDVCDGCGGSIHHTRLSSLPLTERCGRCR